MSRRGWSIVQVVTVGIAMVPLSAFLWFESALLGHPFMASQPSPTGVVISRVLLAVAVLVWGVPVVVAWRQLGRQAAGMTGAIMGAGLISGLALVTITGAW
ncbi:hypothetical protein HP550_18030 [Cellulomonas humilata]|uniref:Uncharacterized protein n=1 Tax=Cellulomonas humilata TaxID=144055 RepID=A0A7Y6A3M3_9CELL|nr:hypothetical protein [Cellulomonas humilata]NUU19151.1 hypothetical protein [Cellulomonas humilata]